MNWIKLLIANMAGQISYEAVTFGDYQASKTSYGGAFKLLQDCDYSLKDYIQS